jgi:hypothetical protein
MKFLKSLKPFIRNYNTKNPYEQFELVKNSISETSFIYKYLKDDLKRNYLIAFKAFCTWHDNKESIECPLKHAPNFLFDHELFLDFLSEKLIEKNLKTLKKIPQKWQNNEDLLCVILKKCPFEFNNIVPNHLKYNKDIIDACQEGLDKAHQEFIPNFLKREEERKNQSRIYFVE